MKKIIIALAVLVSTCIGAQARTNKCIPPKNAHKRVAQTAHHQVKVLAASSAYQVCREQGGYYVCCLHKDAFVGPLAEK